MQQRYQQLYRQLFALIVAGSAWSQEADRLRREMDALKIPGVSPGSKREDEIKTAWGREVGHKLYAAHYYGAGR